MIKPETIRDNLDELINRRPFTPFVLSLDNGEIIKIGDYRSIAYSMEAGEYDFYVRTGRRLVVGHFDGVNNIQVGTAVASSSSNGNGHPE